MSKIIKTSIFIFLLFSQNSFARDYIRMAGSSTVYPFARSIAEEFGNNSKFRTPIVEATGTGGGIKLFCSGAGEKFVDFANASRQIKETEVKVCNRNGVKNIVEIKIGYDGIVIANSKESAAFSLTKEHLFLALANEISQNGKLIKNPNEKWSDVDKSFPNNPIVVYGPPPSSGTRDAFVELVLEKACVKKPAFIAAYPDKKNRKKKCHIVRSDGKFVEAGENDNLIIQKLTNNKDALGIFGFSFLEQNAGIIQGAKIDGSYPTFENIASGKYHISRPLFIYFKTEQLPFAKGLKEFIAEIVSENAIGEDGYLVEKGLIPLESDVISKMEKDILSGL
ncbi:MAG: phosphate transport system substrate-binding protein [Lentimonas sp.]|jgi:phosphate transport system substrate-binding protein